eukprot:6100144-Amphidinium_carterae.1
MRAVASEWEIEKQLCPANPVITKSLCHITTLDWVVAIGVSSNSTDHYSTRVIVFQLSSLAWLLWGIGWWDGQPTGHFACGTQDDKKNDTDAFLSEIAQKQKSFRSRGSMGFLPQLMGGQRHDFYDTSARHVKKALLHCARKF